MSPKEKEVVRNRAKIREYVKSSAISQMQDYNKWGIMTDWRYSYLTMSKSLSIFNIHSSARLRGLSP